jgi:hypothetical protein
LTNPCGVVFAVRVAGPLPTLQLSNQAGSTWQRTLQPGQVLQAMVLSSATAGTALLRVGALELIARTELALTRDQSLLLEVVKGGDQPELRILRPVGEEELVARALRTSLPRQAPLADQLWRIVDAARQMLGDRVTAPLGREIAAALLGRPITTGTEPAALRQALAQSGLLFEAHLAQGQFDAADLKATLLRVLARLQGQARSHSAGADPVPGPARGNGGQATPGPEPHAGLVETLRHLVEDALAGVRWQQISSLPDDGGRGFLWHVGLPLRAPDDAPTTLWLRAGRDADGREGEGRRWTVDLSLSIAPLGPVHARLSLLDERVSATIWAESPETAGLIASHLDLLGAGLERAGIPVAHLAARPGRPPTAADQPAPPLHGLLDERA